MITDGMVTEGTPHPRTFGTYPKFLGECVREKRWLPLEEAIVCTGALAAQRFGLRGRGLSSPAHLRTWLCSTRIGSAPVPTTMTRPGTLTESTTSSSTAARRYGTAASPDSAPESYCAPSLRGVRDDSRWRRASALSRQPGRGSIVRLAGLAAFVTGGGNGIGRGCALALARDGADVAVNDIRMDAATAVAAEIEALGRRALAFTADAADRRAVEQGFAAAERALGPVSIVVANIAAGVRKPFLDLTADDLRSVLAATIGRFSTHSRSRPDGCGSGASPAASW